MKLGRYFAGMKPVLRSQSILCAMMALLWPLIVILCVIGSSSENSWPEEALTEKMKFSWLLRSCAGLSYVGDRYRLLPREKGYLLQDAEGSKTLQIPVPEAWLKRQYVQEEEEVAYVSSIKWEESVNDFEIGQVGATGLHLWSYQIQKGGGQHRWQQEETFFLYLSVTERCIRD